MFTSRLSLCVHTYLSNHELFVPKQTAHLTVFRFCIMAGVFGGYSQLFRLFHVINFVGVRFVSISSFAFVIKRFVRRENPERELQLKKKKFSDTSGELRSFRSMVRSFQVRSFQTIVRSFHKMVSSVHKKVSSFQI